MNRMFLLSLVSLLLACGAAWTVPMTIEADGMANVNGSRLFVLGLYENPEEDAELARAVAAGFNLVRSSADTAALDRLQQHSVYGWVNTGASIDLSEDVDARRAALQKMSAALNNHPAMMVWEVPDEALWNCWYEALTWRRHQEPGQLGRQIAAVTDETQRQTLNDRHAEAEALFRIGRYAEAEAMVDNLWREMKMEPPRPGYGLGNAVERAAKMQAGMVAGYQELKTLSGRPIWMNHAPRNQVNQLAAFNEAADIVGCDIYPVPLHPRVGHSDLTDRHMSSLGAYTARMQAAAPGKPVWMVLQGFGWGDIQPDQAEEIRKELRRPTLAETRYMAYDTIVHGARGILYWGTHAVEKDSPFYADLLKVVSELRDLQPVLSAPDAPMNISVSFAQTLGSVDRDAVVLAKQAGDTPWLLIVNEWTDGLTVTLSGLDSLNGAVYRERLTGTQVEVKDGKISLNMPSQEAFVLEPVTQP